MEPVSKVSADEIIAYGVLGIQWLIEGSVRGGRVLSGKVRTWEF